MIRDRLPFEAHEMDTLETTAMHVCKPTGLTATTVRTSHSSSCTAPEDGCCLIENRPVHWTLRSRGRRDALTLVKTMTLLNIDILCSTRARVERAFPHAVIYHLTFLHAMVERLDASPTSPIGLRCCGKAPCTQGG